MTVKRRRITNMNIFFIGQFQYLTKVIGISEKSVENRYTGLVFQRGFLPLQGIYLPKNQYV